MLSHPSITWMRAAAKSDSLMQMCATARMVQVLILAVAGGLPPNHRCRQGTRRHWGIPCRGFVLLHAITARKFVDNGARVPWSGHLPVRARDCLNHVGSAERDRLGFGEEIAKCCREYSAAAC